MSFASPLWLLALALIPTGVVVAAWLRQRTRREAIRFTAVATLREVAATVPARRRDLPAMMLLLAAGLLAVALARPRIRVRSPVGDAAIMVVSDHSGSMAATDVAPTRLAAARAAADRFIDSLPGSVSVGAIDFSTRPEATQGPTRDHAPARAVVDGGSAQGDTDTGAALALALELLHGGDRRHPPSAIVLLSDGAANRGPDPAVLARQARRDRIAIDTVALGTRIGVLPGGGRHGGPLDVPPDPRLMRQIAEISRGRSFDARTAGQLSSSYATLGRQLGTVRRTHDLTVVAILAAAACVLAAALGSARWAALAT